MEKLGKTLIKRLGRELEIKGIVTLFIFKKLNI